MEPIACLSLVSEYFRFSNACAQGAVEFRNMLQCSVLGLLDRDDDRSHHRFDFLVLLDKESGCGSLASTFGFQYAEVFQDSQAAVASPSHPQDTNQARPKTAAMRSLAI